MTDAAWDKLTAGQQAAIVEAGKFASEFNGNESEKIEKKCITELEAAGVTFVEVTDIQEWKDACADVISEAIKGQEDDYNAIVDMA